MKKQKRTFSLSLLVRVFLAVIVVVSLVVFVNSVMKYNQLLEKQQELEETRNELVEEKEELEELMQMGDGESYVIRMARRFWGLFFPDEEIFFNDRNS